jgi:hypothetical protein
MGHPIRNSKFRNSDLSGVCSGGPSSCYSSASRSRCPACHCTRGCPMRTSKHRHRSR